MGFDFIDTTAVQMATALLDLLSTAAAAIAEARRIDAGVREENEIGFPPNHLKRICQFAGPPETAVIELPVNDA